MRANVWEYCNPEGEIEIPKALKFPRVSDYRVDQPLTKLLFEPTAGARATLYRPVARQAIDFDEPSPDQKVSFKTKLNAYQMEEKLVENIRQGINCRYCLEIIG